VPKPYDIGGALPEPEAVNRLQHALNAGRVLLPCPACGETKPPLVGKPLGARRVVRCLGCGGFFTVPAGLTDAEIAGRWDERAKSEKSR
jgi:hypothetical protein